ncbi:hypothetical protein BGZ60DRAFT_260746 [Tricladium varicosporioides]|nr:hypothetical protein BGZ60DRAFT_260746 [Hymenoscyphus varicosporioides]
MSFSTARHALGLRANFLSFPLHVSAFVLSFLVAHQNTIKFFSVGTMIGAAVLSPSFFPASLGLRGWYKLTIGIYVASTTTFAWAFRRELEKNGKYAIIVISILGILAFLKPPFSPEHFLPFLPVSVAVTLVATACVTPVIRDYFESNDNESSTGVSMAGLRHLRQNSERGPWDVESQVFSEDAYGVSPSIGPWTPLTTSHMLDHSHGIQGSHISSSAGSRSDTEEIESSSSTASANSREPFL